MAWTDDRMTSPSGRVVVSLEAGRRAQGVDGGQHLGEVGDVVVVPVRLPPASEQPRADVVDLGACRPADGCAVVPPPPPQRVHPDTLARVGRRRQVVARRRSHALAYAVPVARSTSPVTMKATDRTMPLSADRS